MPDDPLGASARGRARAVAAVALVAVALLRPERGGAGAFYARGARPPPLRSARTTARRRAVNNTKLRIYRPTTRRTTTGTRSGTARRTRATTTTGRPTTTACWTSAVELAELDALNHTYCGMPNAITKNTQSSSNATASFQFYVDYLGAFCQSLEDCHIGCSSRAFKRSTPRSRAPT